MEPSEKPNEPKETPVFLAPDVKRVVSFTPKSLRPFDFGGPERSSPLLGRHQPGHASEGEGQMKRTKSGDLRERDALNFEGEVIDTNKKRRRARRRRVKPPPQEEEVSKEEEIVSVEEAEESFQCLVARSALIIPFSYPEDKKKSAVQWVTDLLELEFVDKDGLRKKIWKTAEDLPPEVVDLNRQFRQVFGWKHDKRSSQTWTCWRIESTCFFLRMFQFGKIGAFENGDELELPFELEKIELIFYPFGAGILVLHLNWNPRSLGKLVTLSDVRTRIYVAKYKHRIPALTEGWNFFQEMPSPHLPQAHIDSLGPHVCSILYGPKYVSLETLTSIFLSLPPFEPSPFVLEPFRHVFHHSSVVLEKEVSHITLKEYLFSLKRGFGQKNRPPPNVEEVMCWRLNRYIGIAREGVVSLSWPLEPAGAQLLFSRRLPIEAERWGNKFQGIFLLLTLHSHAEKLVLGHLSDLAATYAENLNEEVGNSLPPFVPPLQPTGKQGFPVEQVSASLEMMKYARNNLRVLASLLARYMLSMSSDDCGGISEYSEFFSNLRFEFGIPDLREELSTELHDVLAVVDSNYLEEERNQRSQLQLLRTINYRRQKNRDRNKERRNRNMEILLLILTSLVVPFTVVSGIFGMNIHSLPLDVSFWGLMGGTLGVSVLIMLAILVLRWWANREVEEEVLEHDLEEIPEGLPRG